MEFPDKSVIVTGAARGIGGAIAKYFATEGARVLLCDWADAEPAAEAIRAAGGTAKAFRGDVSKAEDMEAAVAEAVRAHGRLDVFVAAAAFSLRAPFWEQKLEDARVTLDVTLWGAFLGVRSAAKQMIEQGEGGSMVVVGSPHAIVPEPLCMAYNMAKAGVDMMAKTAAAELIPHRVRVNIVHPGWTDTPGERRFFTEEQIARQGKLLPAGRLARPEEIARAVGFLASPASEYINGTILTVDGGLQLPMGAIV